MNTSQSESPFRRVVTTASRYIPQVEKPKKKISLTEKFVWCGIALFAYLIMGQIPLYGVTDDPAFDFCSAARYIDGIGDRPNSYSRIAHAIAERLKSD
jgi:hypothetical protein